MSYPVYPEKKLPPSPPVAALIADPFVKPSVMAQMIGLSAAYLRHAAKHDGMPAIVTPGKKPRYLFRLSAVKAWLEARSKTALAAARAPVDT